MNTVLIGTSRCHMIRSFHQNIKEFYASEFAYVTRHSLPPWSSLISSEPSGITSTSTGRPQLDSPRSQPVANGS